MRWGIGSSTKLATVGFKFAYHNQNYMQKNVPLHVISILQWASYIPSVFRCPNSISDMFCKAVMFPMRISGSNYNLPEFHMHRGSQP